MGNPEVVIVGGGLSGLCCARRLVEGGIIPVILEASDALGGRIRTDEVDGFLLDRGFQVLLKAYPEARRVLDYDALELGAFYPGVLVRFDGEMHRLADPWRRPWDAISTVLSPIGTLSDKVRIGRVRSMLQKGPLDLPEMPTHEALRRLGFSEGMIERFFRPFLGGVFLDAGLETSSRMFEFVYRMFSLDDATLPARGMGAIPCQIAAGLEGASIRTGTTVSSLAHGGVSLETGETIKAETVVLAVDEPQALRLLGQARPARARSVTCLYFAAARPPIEDPILVLNGEGSGLVNNLCVPSQVSPGYAPSGRSLISVTVLGLPESSDEDLKKKVLDELTDWFGAVVKTWRHLRTYRIPYALPVRGGGMDSSPGGPRWGPGLYVCGDYLENASIHGAMFSGRRAAEAVLSDLDGGAF